MSRLAILVSHPTQYYSPWFRWLQQKEGRQLRVFYLWDAGVTPTHDPHFQKTFAWDVDLLSGYEHEFVPNVANPPTTEHYKGLDNPTLTRRLASWKPDCVLVFGYAYRSHVRAIFWAWRTRTPLIFRGDSHFLGRSPSTGMKGRLQRFLYRRFSAITFVGKANRAYFEALGVGPAKLFFAPHCVDHTLFDPALTAHQQQCDRLRQQLGIAPSTRVILFAGKLTPSKQPRELLNAFIDLARPKTALVIVGDGEEKAALQARAFTSGYVDKSVFFLPFANQGEMPSRYLLASLFVLPSRGVYETWGLTINEAMMMSVPCLVSDRVGCQQDLVTHGETGWVFSADDRFALREGLREALDTLDAHEERIRSAVRDRISGYTYAQASVGLKRAIEYAVGNS